MTTRKPGKGLHTDLIEAVLAPLQEALQDLDYVYSDADHDQNPKGIVDALVETYGWTKESDSFGLKAYKATDFPDGDEIRVTVVLTKRGQLKLDIRSWYEEG